MSGRHPGSLPTRRRDGAAAWRRTRLGSALLALLLLSGLAGPVRAPAEAAAEDVRRVADGNRITTAIAVARHGWPDGAEHVLLATADAFPDALAAGALAASLDAPLLLSGPEALPREVRDELDRLDPNTVVLLGGVDALGEEIADAVAADGRTVERVGGTDRYGTAADLAARAGASGGRYAIVSGTGFPDALAAGALAALPEPPPVLLADDVPLRDATVRGLDDLALDPATARGLVLGGSAAVPAAVDATLPGTVTRLEGPSRYETSQAVAAYTLGRLDAAPRPLLVATAEDFPDGLAAGALAARLDAPLLLVPRAGLPASSAAFVRRHRARFDEVLVVGGEAAVSGRVLHQLGRVLDGLPADPVWEPDVDTARAYADGRAGSVAFAAIGTDGRLVGHRAEVAVPAASVLKVMFMVAYLRQPSVRDRDLTDADRALLEPMIRESANAPATTIANLLGPGPLHELAAEAGMRQFSYTRPWGLSTTSARDQAHFMLHLEEFLPARHRAEALRLLAEIVPEQRWGIGQVPTPGWTQHFKGGWGSGTGAVNHQVVLLRHCHGTRVAAAVTTTSSPDHAYGEVTLEGTFARLLATLDTGC